MLVVTAPSHIIKALEITQTLSVRNNINTKTKHRTSYLNFMEGGIKNVDV